MKVKLSEVWRAVNPRAGAMTPIDTMLKMQGVKAKTGIHIARLAKALAQEYGTLNEKRLEIMKKHAEVTENGEIKQDAENKVAWKEGGLEGYIKEFGELLDEEIEVNAEKVKFSEVMMIEPSLLFEMESFVEVA